MARHTQFEYFTPEKAAAYLAQFAGDFPSPRTTENHADRIAAARRLEPVTTNAERAAAHAFNANRQPGADPMTLTPTITVPPNTPAKECRSCGKRIYWIRTLAGKAMPVDCSVQTGRDPVPSKKGTNGAGYQGIEGRGVSHFATCKQADQWRKPKGG